MKNLHKISENFSSLEVWRKTENVELNFGGNIKI